ncbi:MAG TPA: 50S ribosomal protein L30 [Saprospiraceae bacterium]|mgnify:FL=1|jgi:large subunit ribosomal protein L30|nr:50S ribosomal protein L30 [Saprospiraceae bacterium]MCC6689148.1 50S ribosomal protein L30 [Saprospiraceae bacterium]HMV23976.1 50S ribosomal protein L30 [Saprospiraceae bacterium]HMW74282.1 50S ribosomal protein L30 [Saprospiraceae bacterium]HMX82030.1 50S ribosomal protein L30 [Saprospiraceae bacterium]
MTKLKLTQVKSVIDRPKDQKFTMRSLGLKKVYHSVEIDATPSNVGMVEKVKHLLKVEKV